VADAGARAKVISAKIESGTDAAAVGTSGQVLLAHVRSIAQDLLQATGLSRDEARATMA
jgi:hypothetical protein